MFAGRNKTQLFDWKKTVAYALTPSSNGIHIRVSRRPGQIGIPPERYESFRNELIAALLAFTDPQSGEPIVKRVMTREEAFGGSQMHLAPDLTLVLRDQGFISTVNADVPLKSRSEPKGMHRPEGIFIAAGAGIRQGLRIRQLSITDVCPALLYSLGLDIPRNLDGRLPVEVFEPSFLEAHRPAIEEYTTPRSSVPPPISSASMSPEEEASLISRLEALGYLEE
jgi:predicted AlkP superfamily phosphohydrolase/phosphomutase